MADHARPKLKLGLPLFLFCGVFWSVLALDAGTAHAYTVWHKPQLFCQQQLLAGRIRAPLAAAVSYNAQRATLYQILNEVVQGKMTAAAAIKRVAQRLAQARRDDDLRYLSWWWVQLENIWLELGEHQVWPSQDFFKALAAMEDNHLALPPAMDWWQQTWPTPHQTLTLAQEKDLGKIFFAVYNNYLQQAYQVLEHLMPGQWRLVNVAAMPELTRAVGSPGLVEMAASDEALAQREAGRPIYELQLDLASAASELAAPSSGWQIWPKAKAGWAKIRQLYGRRVALARPISPFAAYPFMNVLQWGKDRVRQLWQLGQITEAAFTFVYGHATEMRHLRDTGRFLDLDYVEYAKIVGHRLSLPSSFFVNRERSSTYTIEHELVHYQLVEQKMDLTMSSVGKLPLFKDAAYGRGFNLSEIDAYLNGMISNQNYLAQHKAQLSPGQIDDVQQMIHHDQKTLQKLLTQTIIHLEAIWLYLRNADEEDLLEKIQLQALRPSANTPLTNIDQSINFWLYYPHPAQYFSLGPEAYPAEELVVGYIFRQRPEMWQAIKDVTLELTPRDIFNGVQALTGEKEWQQVAAAYGQEKYQDWSRKNLRGDLLRSCKLSLLEEFKELVTVELQAYRDLYQNVFGVNFYDDARTNKKLAPAYHDVIVDFEWRKNHYYDD